MGRAQPLALPPWLALAAAVAALDLAMYFQHVLFHAVPALWQLHRVHHADSDFDVTTGVRFHPAEMLISALIKLAAVAALGPPVLAVLVFEVLLNATSMFNHGNVRLPLAADRLLRRLIVTPDMPRAPLGRAARVEQQLRLQPVVVGPPVRHLPRAARRRPRAHDDRREPQVR